MANMTEAFDFAMIVLVIVPFISLYFMPKSYLRLDRRMLLHGIVQGLFFIITMIFLEYLASDNQEIISKPLTETQFFIFGALLLAAYSYYFSVTFCRALNLQTLIERKESVSQRIVDKNLSSSIISLRAKEFRPNWRTLQKIRPSYLVPGPLYLNYHVLIGQHNKESERSASVTLIQSPRNAQGYRILVFISGTFMLFARAQDVEKPTIRTFVRLENVDAQLWFAAGVIILLIFTIGLVFFAEMIILVMEENYNKAIRGEALSFAFQRPKIPEKPEVDIEEVRRKARERLDKSRKAAEEERTKQIEKVMGRVSKEEDTGVRVNPEVIRLEALIREVQNILMSTPPHQIVTVNEIVAKAGGKTNEQEVESIIIGLIRRKEVRGRFNIWTKSYQGGDESERFIERKLLELAEGDTKNLSRLKIGADGSVEFQFIPNPHEDRNSELKEASKPVKKPKNVEK
ncbi:MAG: hypothetical protein ACFFDT_02065 [Candidatus Hodarchaeota archaeon]